MAGVTINISRTGLLLATGDSGLAVGDQIDFLVQLPSPEGTPCGEARCKGRVVRMVPLKADHGGVAIALTIDRYVLERESGTSRQPASHVIK